MRSNSIIALLLAAAAVVEAQGPPGGRGAPQPPRTPRAAAPVDLTGYWVSVVYEDWLWRMIAGAPYGPSARENPKDPASACEQAAGIAVLASPIAPWRGAPLRVVLTVEEPLEGTLSLIAMG